MKIARFIRENITDQDRIAVIGSEPQIYFYSGICSATGYLYTYPLMEIQPYALQMQQEMIKQIEEAQPKFLIFVNINTFWLVRPNSEKMIFHWYKRYCQKYYHKCGVIEILSLQQSSYRWGPEAIGYIPRSKHWISVYKRSIYTDPK